MNYMQPEYRVDGDTLLVGFGPDSGAARPRGRGGRACAAARGSTETQELRRRARHDWVADEFAKGTWSMYRPGQLTGSLRELQAAARAACCWPAPTWRTAGTAS